MLTLRMFSWMVMVALLGTSAAFAADPPKKLAFLVGVSEYDKAGLRNLKFAEADIRDLADELKRAHFTVKVLLGSATASDRATAENLRRQLTEEFVEQIKTLKKNDLVLFAFAGHGVQRVVPKGGKQVEDVLFCPVDCVVNANDTRTFLSISDLMDGVAANSGSENNLFVIDACRDNPSRGRGIDGGKVNGLPANMACLFGASSGTQSYESDKLKHGLLTYYLLEGLRGKAKDEDGDITWDSLVSYSKKQITRNAKNLVEEDQVPNSISNLKGESPVLARLDLRSVAAVEQPKPGETIANSIGMNLTLIPTGEFLMGNEQPVGDLLKTFPYAKQEWVEDAARRHKVRISKPFYMGTYTVTLGQFLTFYHEAKYKCESERDGKGGSGLTGDINNPIEQRPAFTPWSWGFKEQSMNHPVVNVTWNDADAFCKWLSKKEGKTYRLPTEAEWEYACRAGTTTRYFFGNDPEDLAKYANVGDATANARLPLSSAVKASLNMIKASDGYALTAPVGSFRPNPFGLYDMHGNVCQWCQDYYGKDYYNVSPTDDPRGPAAGTSRVQRGGGWLSNAEFCRAAHRTDFAPSLRDGNVGFRVVLSR